ncbi:methylmalonate-semialdehyde dehydrogenase (CoA acylating) [bacterium (Candidatus Blackallbacteria) CG17_big_fil_post_rev_8_21_14_2_50_48_46]|uniref:methylmalonate-semialdehyde dehydrogenase (CoA acylating) n=1 Tax=bacterium (Candidatus Blackallbacteria) CG17_big_fil_post_rev_8_21_14_2_50_48_46 TaxID=2014261 RepID=A0A2M7G816_9BACT|nr:MAG: methylmalonate-semialdehyde dehydrogenase (CoA acylating) [bacterium (Candidatus Blackallbacteria) CG18_big_fil_WC_8_21_14_2_50_49_26]PIW18226.1 MAG: methylmalonate-semialdehyde dehydrogenase (CoA acylating) [bacterium (Candidatus Blackallbacteria) CG17_big_fil_post_rev_8_21_14_2_50_48_46]PIW50657.1 MAG: methylmalonate-semialdehyde dehydrogenase (CoA acylating) [bacterium (Candidatus Blackallbacteria) CG13_big_fil_rev_8_21_14_2_50_49_14]
MQVLRNYIHGEFVPSSSSEVLDVINPATEEVLAQVPLSNRADLDAAVASAKAAFPSWRRTPPAERAKYIFRFKNLMEEHFDEIATLVTQEHGKTFAEAQGDVRRGIDNLDVACGIPSLMQGETLEDVGRGIDCVSTRRAMGVYGAITPFNFPAMVPLWFMPYAIATGNTFVLKPSEQVPLTQQRMFELWHQTGLPKGVIQMVHGAKEMVNGLCEHPDIVGVSFVGSTPVAKHVYETGTRHHKRVQALGGAKNFLVVMPDAEPEMTTQILSDSCFGCAGERCLAGATLILVGQAYEIFKDRLVAKAKEIKVGNGLEEGVLMGPVISKGHKERVIGYIEKGVAEGAELLLDGRIGYENSKGYFLGPTVFDKVTPEMTIGKEEVFGPVLCLIKAESLDEAIAIIEKHELANTTSIFTQNGKWAREFCYNVSPSMMGINIGVAAPMSFFNFGGTKQSFFGDLKAHGKHGIEFYTERKVVISRWL